MNPKLKNDALLVLTALIWGSAFVAQSVGMDYLGPFTFNSLRCLMGGLVLLPVIWFMGRKGPGGRKKTKPRADTQTGTIDQELAEDKKTLWIGGICCGIALAAASSLQQIGLVYTSAGKAGFITALYILIVPLLGLFLGKKVGGKTWAGVGLAVLGMYFLCIKEGFFISYGDFLVMICAFIFSLHILIIDYFSPKVDGVKLSCIQFWIAGILCALPMILNEKPTPGAVAAAWLPLLYAGGSFLRGRLYVTDHCTKKYGPHGGIFDTKPGIRICGTYRLAAHKRDAVAEGIIWVCAGIYRYYSGTAPSKTACIVPSLRYMVQQFLPLCFDSYRACPACVNNSL